MIIKRIKICFALLITLSRVFFQLLYGAWRISKLSEPLVSIFGGTHLRDTAIYLHVAQQLAIPPEECIAIEDSAHGITAARAANMLCIGIGTSQDREQTRMAHVTITNYEEIDLDQLLAITRHSRVGEE